MLRKLRSWIRDFFQRHGKRLPQGLTEEQFRSLSQKVRERAGHLGEDIRIQGSRVTGRARPGSDLDIAVMVSPTRFDEILEQSFGRPNTGSAKERTMQHAHQMGKIQAGELGLRALRRELEKELALEVDLSVIRAGGRFDSGPYIPLLKGKEE